MKDTLHRLQPPGSSARSMARVLGRFCVASLLFLFGGSSSFALDILGNGPALTAPATNSYMLANPDNTYYIMRNDYPAPVNQDAADGLNDGYIQANDDIKLIDSEGPFEVYPIGSSNLIAIVRANGEVFVTSAEFTHITEMDEDNPTDGAQVPYTTANDLAPLDAKYFKAWVDNYANIAGTYHEKIRRVVASQGFRIIPSYSNYMPTAVLMEDGTLLVANAFPNNIAVVSLETFASQATTYKITDPTVGIVDAQWIARYFTGVPDILLITRADGTQMSLEFDGTTEFNYVDNHSDGVTDKKIRLDLLYNTFPTALPASPSTADFWKWTSSSGTDFGFMGPINGGSITVTRYNPTTGNFEALNLRQGITWDRYEFGPDGQTAIANGTDDGIVDIDALFAYNQQNPSVVNLILWTDSTGQSFYVAPGVDKATNVPLSYAITREDGTLWWMTHNMPVNGADIEDDTVGSLNYQNIVHTFYGQPLPPPDSDGDGVPDDADLDDDNDGILDVDEDTCQMPYTVYAGSRTNAAYASNISVSIAGASTTSAVLNQTVAGTYSYNNYNWREIATNISPSAGNQITVSITTDGANNSWVIADAWMITNGANTYVVDNTDAAFSSTGTWTVQAVGGEYGSNHRYAATSGAVETATWTFSNISALPLGICDTDGDTIPDSLDLDSDGDGILDVVEAGHGAADADGDGKVDGPVGSNGLPDAVETTADSGTINYTVEDTDGDGTPDFQDVDSDNDGISDLIEGGTSPALDADNDGVIDDQTDTDGDGIVDGVDPDDGGNAASVPDTDSDGTPDYQDLDSDNDGINDLVESGGTDADGDGIIDTPGTITDGSTVGTDYVTPPATSTLPSSLDSNGDGVIDDNTDTDGDGIPDVVDGSVNSYGDTPVDSDGDGIEDIYDLDDDNDGIPDSVEAATAINGGDTDGDGIPDHLDLDADNDGILDIEEAGHGADDSNSDGRLDGAVGSDGIPDTVQDSGLENTGVVNYMVEDTDGDGAPDYQDLDSDNDGINDVIEAHGTDADGDGIADDSDSMPDANGILDTVPAGGATPPDTDGDNVHDYQDLDSDNDGINDVIEAGNSDPDNNGIVGTGTLPTDTDGDGIPDVDDANNGFGDDGDTAPLNSDNDDVPDYRDLDSDNDTIGDVSEGGNGALDSNGDGTISAADANGTDSDGDGIPDAIDEDPTGYGDAGNGSIPEQGGSDTDTIPDYRDVDSDGDGTNDIASTGNAALDADNDGYVDSPSDPDGDGIVNNNGVDTSPNSFAGIGVPETFEFWQTNNQPDTGSTPDADNDMDGVDDLCEWAFGSDAGTGAYAGLWWEFTNQNSVRVFYTRPVNLPNVTYELLVAGTLSGTVQWDVSTIVPTVTSNADGTETVSYAALQNDTNVTIQEGFAALRVRLTDGANKDATCYSKPIGWCQTQLYQTNQTYGYPWLKNPILAGAISASDSSSVTVAAASLASGDVSALFESGSEYYLEITSGTAEGHRFEVDEDASSGSILTIDMTVPAANRPSDGVSTGLLGDIGNLSGSTFILRPHVTINEILDKDLFIGDTDPAQADQVSIFGDNQAYTTYSLLDARTVDPNYYYWMTVGDAITSVDSVPVAPGEGMFVKLAPSAHVTMLHGGLIRCNVFRQPLVKGYTFAASGFPEALSPEERNLISGFGPNPDPNLGDQFSVWDFDSDATTEAFTTYWLLPAPFEYWAPIGDPANDQNEIPHFKFCRAVFLLSRAGQAGYQVSVPYELNLGQR